MPKGIYKRTKEQKQKLKEQGFKKNNPFGKLTKGRKFPNRICFEDEKSNRWKGDNAGKLAMHQWVKKHKGKAIEYQCEYCGKQAKHWANKKHDYKRNLNDYMALCVSCHKIYDLKNNLIN